MILIALFLVILSSVAYVRLVIFTHWRRHGIPSLKPSILWGNLASVMTRKSSFGFNIAELYDQTKEPLIGIYLLWRPAILLRDATLVKQVLGPDFAHFHDRGIYTRPEADPISDSIFAMTGHRWRQLRSKLTPMFTAGRMKNMLPTVLEKADHLVNALSEKADNGETIEIKDFTARFGLDTIASNFFGLDIDTITNRKHSFRVIEKQTQSKNYLFNLVPMLSFLCPGFLSFLRLPSIPPAAKKYIIKLLTTQIEQREHEDVIRKDFIQMLIQIRNSGQLNKDESDWQVKAVSADKQTMSVEQCAAQVFIFYIAGFDTTASLAAFTMFELARNQRVKMLLRAEIDQVLSKHGGELSFDSIKEMKYLELCVLETLRKYPVLPLLNRICTKDYQVPDSEYTIKEGTAVVISLFGAARDPKYFPEPLSYRPERFSDDPPAFDVDAYIPFGDGPRNCIGLRLGKLMAKVGIIKLLQNYDFHKLNDDEIEIDNRGVTLLPKGGIPLRITKW